VLIAATLVLVACSQPLPTPQCDRHDTPDNPLGCQRAVSAALRALPVDHPRITRIQFLYGSPTVGGCGAVPTVIRQICSYVIFTWADGSPRKFVAVVWSEGSIAVASPAPL
jgi:hypothetical protein